MHVYEALMDNEVVFQTGFRHRVGPRLCPWHQHAVWELVYHPVGNGSTGVDDGTTIAFREGSVVLYPPGVAHNQVNALAGEDWCIHWQFAATVPALAPTPCYVPLLASPILHTDLRELTCGNAPPFDDPARLRARSCRLTAVLLQLLADGRAAADPDAAGEQYVAAAREYLNEQATTLRHLDEVAAHVGISYDYLRHLFRDVTGVSLHEYAQTVRIEQAKALLEHSAFPVKTITTLCGFSSTRYFAAVFRQRVGATPMSYRQRAHGG
ncbi:MAG TPA: helix-turn-helix domain-containing protein [Armatimonadota bacterium]|jgi:AraC-like DNA-binding protein